MNARGSGLSTLKVPITWSCKISGTVSELLAPLHAEQIERILGRVFAEIALAGGGDEPRHAVVLRLGIQHAIGGRFGSMPDRQQRLEPPRLLIEQANLHDVELQQVFRVMQDVRFEQLDPFLDRHVREFVGSQIGQLHAGLMNGGQLLLLEHFLGDVVHRDDQVLRRAARLPDRGRMDVEDSGCRRSGASCCCLCRWPRPNGRGRSRGRESPGCSGPRRNSSPRPTRGRSIRPPGRCPR